MGWIHWYPSPVCESGAQISLDDSLNAFLRDVVPSEVPSNRCHWVSVHNAVPSSPGYGSSNSAVGVSSAPYDDFLRKLERQCSDSSSSPADAAAATAKKECTASILATAVALGQTAGKWMFFRPKAELDATWAAVARATAAGRLGCSCKTAVAGGDDERGGGDGDGPPRRRKKSYLCCVYVKDFSDCAEVKRVLLALRYELEINIVCGFKPDFFTGIGIESNNRWGLKATIFSPNEVEEW